VPLQEEKRDNSDFMEEFLHADDKEEGRMFTEIE
jgi:hypothetical protein